MVLTLDGGGSCFRADDVTISVTFHMALPSPTTGQKLRPGCLLSSLVHGIIMPRCTGLVTCATGFYEQRNSEVDTAGTARAYHRRRLHPTVDKQGSGGPASGWRRDIRGGKNKPRYPLGKRAY